ncbi:MAG TPA: hypothetical protein VMV19_03525 [Xanthobacteraceae bacterium]|nr:hypothetical protein [Xanthobacteraceae bacterium]
MGDETALKVRSHPTGMFACVGGNDRDPSWCGKTAGLIDRKRSPLSVRFTDGDSKVDMPCVKEGKEMKLAANNASVTPAARTQNKLRIGTTPQLACAIPEPLRDAPRIFSAPELQRSWPDGGSVTPKWRPHTCVIA